MANTANTAKKYGKHTANTARVNTAKNKINYTMSMGVHRNEKLVL